MFHHDPGAMLHAPLRTEIYADRAGDTQFIVDQPSTHFASYAVPEIAEVGLHLDQLLAGLLTAMGARLPAELAKRA
jgi:hypothetical protein